LTPNQGELQPLLDLDAKGKSAFQEVSLTLALTCFLSPGVDITLHDFWLAQAPAPIQAWVCNERGERFSFSPGEKAGMRAGVELTFLGRD